MTRRYVLLCALAIAVTCCVTRSAIAQVDAGWDNRFAPAADGGLGMDAYVLAIAVQGSDVYAGGGFTTAGAVSASHIARWDGAAWSALGSGTDGDVNALAVIGSDLYVGGAFTTAGGVAANGIAKWDGSAWSAVGSGTNGVVKVLAVSGTTLYVGGTFTTAGGVSAGRIAKWDGAAWSAVGSGMNDEVWSLATSGSDLYAGGAFTTAGGVSAARIARWNGSAWSALGSGIDRRVFDLAVVGSTLYAAGEFHNAGGVATEFIAQWNGGAWSAVGAGASGDVHCLRAVGTDVYAGGDFAAMSGIPVNNVAKWNGSGWSALGSGIQYVPGRNDTVLALNVLGTDLFAGGEFRTAGAMPSSKFAIWHAVCGNGLVDIGEACDDGNAVSDDGCEADCTLSCGNGTLSGAEVCDDGNLISGDGCDANCTPTGCGNGVASPGEQCDDGNAVETDACLSTCLLNVCGDAILNTGVEACDDGNLISADGCDENCTPTGCGNGVATPGEPCDDGNAVETDACLSGCLLNVCGDGFVNAGVEACDDGNLVGGDGCDASCALSCVAAPAGLRGWWKADGTGDAEFSSRTATLSNGAGFAVGQVDQAFALDGVDDFVSVADDPALDVGTGDWAISLWVNFNSTSGEQILAEKLVSYTPGEGWTVTKRSDTIQFVGLGGGTETGPLGLTTGTWFHVVARRAAGEMAVFLNGSLVASGTSTGDMSSTASLKFGHRGSPSDTPGSDDDRGFYLNGRIDEVQYFVGSAPSDAEILAIYQAGSMGVCATPPVCGNASTDIGEVCDDGNLISGDGCDENCTPSGCGNGVTAGSEQCDDGNGNDTDACLPSCLLSVCGDGFVRAGVEECDDGNLVGGDGCDASCALSCVAAPAGLRGWWKGDGTGDAEFSSRTATLSNGAAFGVGQVDQAFALDGVDDFVSVPDDPALDVGTGDWAISLWVNFNSTSGEQILAEKLVSYTPGEGWTVTKRSDTIQFVGLGGGTETGPLGLTTGTWFHVVARRAAGEMAVFLNGSLVASGTSTGDMSSTASLKFGHRGSPSDTPGSDDDRGFYLNGRIDEVQYFVGSAPSDAEILAIYQAAGSGVCATAPVCGNASADIGEVCDDGNLVSGDGCDENCTPSGCGNGVATSGEGCDDGNAIDGDGCDTNCTLTECGNGIATAGEACDDGNAIDGDGCDSNCTLDSCGNGIVAASEACDDGNAIDGDGCDSNCSLTGCGNAIITAGEACDDGNAVETDECLSACLLNICGDGFAHDGVEACDDGNAIDGDGCDSNCTPSGCGNAILTGAEVCDDGNQVSGDGCDRNCTVTACGNGVRTAGELCDDGNLAGGDGCEATCSASPGQLDPTFDSDGIVLGPSVDEGWYKRTPIAVLDDGRIVVAYTSSSSGNDRFAVARYETDGSLDASFGAGGTTETSIGDQSAVGGMAVQDDGKLVVAGWSDDAAGRRVTLARYDTTGSLDPSFGTGGVVVTTEAEPGSVAKAVAIDSAGGIVVAGGTGSGALLVARYDTGGSLDESFDADGIVIDDRVTEATSLAVQPDRRIVTVGSAGGNLALSRLKSDGSFDNSFGGDGLWIFPSPVQWEPVVALQPDGKIVVAADINGPTSRASGLGRFDADGNLDPTFSTDGVVITDISGDDEDVPEALVIGADGKITVAGWTWRDGYVEVFLARYKSDGAADSGFAPAGYLTTAIGFSHDRGFGIALQADGKVVVAGDSDVDGFSSRLVLLRYLAGTCGDYRAQNEDGEQCDDGNAIDADGCRSDCTLAPVIEYADAGETVSTDPSGNGATASIPVQTSVKTPNAGTVSIAPPATPQVPTGMQVVGFQLQIEAPDASAEVPLAITLTVDATAIPVGVDASRLEVTRDGVLIADCSGPVREASPDPCVESRLVLGDGDVQITVLTSHASLWSLVLRGLFEGEQDCVNSASKSLLAVAKAQGWNNSACLSAASKQSSPDVAGCLATDPRGKVGDAMDQTREIAGKRCVPAPPFGFSGAATANSAVREAVRDLVSDLLGTDVNAAVATDKAPAACQAAVLKGVHRLFIIEAKTYLECAREGLSGKADLVVSAGDLARCLQALAADPGDNIAKSLKRLKRAITVRCGGDFSALLPGECGADADPSLCLGDRVDCRVCTAFDATNGLGADCDSFDDGAINDSCQ